MTMTAYRHENDPPDDGIPPDKTSSAFGCAICFYGLIIIALWILAVAIWGK